MWYVGQKVVCVEAYCEELTRGATYVVSGIDSCCLTWLSFREIPDDGGDDSPCSRCGTLGEEGIWYEADAFRPIDALTEQMERIESEGCPVELEPEYA